MERIRVGKDIEFGFSVIVRVAFKHFVCTYHDASGIRHFFPTNVSKSNFFREIVLRTSAVFLNSGGGRKLIGQQTASD